MDDPVEFAVAATLSAKKYRDLPEATIRRIAASLFPAHPRGKELAKAVKAKLHQVTGLYFDPGSAARTGTLLEGIETLSLPERNERARRILALHVSTAERLPHLPDLSGVCVSEPGTLAPVMSEHASSSVSPDFYAAIFAATGIPGSLLDVACGANPFALPFMGLPPSCAYLGHDIDRRLVDAANRFLATTGLPARCETRDAFDPPPNDSFDVALILKTLPCLERQERGAAARLLSSLPARAIVVSFPARSVGGRNVGMAANYAGFVAALCLQCGMAARALPTPYEPAYVIGRVASG